MAKYSTYIELDPKYESVVDLTSEERHPGLWRDYIVHDDMAKAMEKICESFKNDDPDKRRSFWIHGTYGTGKSYSALVLKHMFEDSIAEIMPFLKKPKLSMYERKFTAIREKGEFLVVWRSGVTGISTETQLLMAAEMSIREALKKKFGNAAYYGTKSLHDVIEEKLNDRAINWDAIFEDPANGLCDDANSMDEIRERVKQEAEQARAAIAAGQDFRAEQTLSQIAKIILNKGWALTATIEQFEAWVKDVIKNNGKLKDGGIMFIWDEFTKFLSNGDTNALQRLSELCKTSPLFMAFIVHREPSFIEKIGEQEYERIFEHRYHELEFNISQDAAYVLIGETIIPRPGHESNWQVIKERLLKGITPSDFLELSNSGAKPIEQIRKVFPVHPMTLRLLTTVVQNFAASERTLFRFMKDPVGKSGFPYFIENNNEDEWAWLTPDFLWDYFFMNSSDLRDAGSEAAKAYRHYNRTIEEGLLSEPDSNAMHVFKAAMLLIAVLSTKAGLVKNRTVDHRLTPTREILYKCFQGQLDKSQVDDALRGLVDSKIIRLDEIMNGRDARLELPYTGDGGDRFAPELKKIKTENTRYKLFIKSGIFAKAIEEKLWDKNLATFNRVYITCAANDTRSIETRLAEVRTELSKCPYKIGILAVAIADAEEYQPLLEKLKNIAFSDTTGRLFVCALKEALTASILEEWYTAKTYEALAREDGKGNSGDAKADEADEKVQIWASSAMGDVIAAFYRDKFYSSIQGRDQLRKFVENDVIFTVYQYAPERIVSVKTAFNPAREDAVYSAIAPSKAPSNQQVANIVNGLKACGIFGATSISDIENNRGSVQASAMAEIAKTIRTMLSDGAAKVALDELWSKLQAPPFGMYNTLTSAYILGFIFKFYVNREFHWYDGIQTTPLSEKDTAKMVHMMCQEKTPNHYLSAGTEAWRLFREYIQYIFGLSDAESANEIESKKHVRIKVTENGTPFWVVKYMCDDAFGGIEDKTAAGKIINNIVSFIIDDNTTDEVMLDVTTAFTGKGRLKKTLRDLYANKTSCYEAFIGFVNDRNSDLEELVKAIGLNRNDFIDALKQCMSGSTWLWSEDDVAERLTGLELDFRIIEVLCNATDTKKKTIDAIALILLNKLDKLKVPGKVLESMGYDFTEALRAMHNIAIGRISNLALDDKRRYLEVLKAGAKSVWLRLSAEKETIKDYVSKKGHTLTDNETERIFSELKLQEYDYNETLFDSDICSMLEQIGDVRRKNDIRRIWFEKSGYETVNEWCNHHALSILWLLPSGAHDAIRIIRDVHNKMALSFDEVKRAHEYITTADLSILKNSIEISNALFRGIGEKYRKIFTAKSNVVVSRLRSEVTSDAYSWATKVGEIQAVIDKLLYDEGLKLKGNIERIIESSDAKVLREHILSLLDEHPELYAYFMEDIKK